MFLKHKSSSWLDQVDKLLTLQEQISKTLFVSLFFVRRISKDDVETLRRNRLSKEIKNVTFQNASIEFRFREVALDRGDGFPIMIDKTRRARAAAECFNSQSSGAREKIKHARIDNAFAKTGEDCRLHPVHRRSHL